jgi:hypothetical protein
MAIATFLLWAVIGWILVASAAYYGALQALETFFGDHADEEQLGSRSGGR